MQEIEMNIHGDMIRIYYLCQLFPTEAVKGTHSRLAQVTHPDFYLSIIQLRTNAIVRLLNKPYVNGVTLSGQNSPLKCC